MRFIKKSLLFEGVCRISGAMRRSAAKGWIPTLLSDFYPCLTKRERTGNLRSHHPHFFLQASENSFFLSGGSQLFCFLGSLSLSSFGRMGLFYGVFSSVIQLILSESHSLLAVAFSLGIAVSSLPILHVEKSLYTELENSRILGGPLFDFCGLIAHEEARCVRRAPWLSLLLPFCAAIAGIYLPNRVLFGGLLLVLFVYLLFVVPELGVCSILFGMPFFQVLPSPTLILLGLTLVTLAAWLKKVLLGRRSCALDLLDRFVLLLAALYVLNGAVGAGGTVSLREGIARAVLLLLWFPVRSLLENKRWQHHASGAICLSSALCAAFGIFTYFFSESELKWVDIARFESLGSRVCGTYSNPNFLALYLVFSLPFFLGILFDRAEHVRKKRLTVLGLLVGCGCLILTWTRGAWIGAAVAVFLFLLLHGRESLGWLLMLPLPTALLLPFIPNPVRLRFLSIGSFEESSISYRFYTWRGVARMLGAYPYGIGVGEAAFQAVYPYYAVSGTESVMHAHRLDLQILTEHGVIGFVCFSGFFLLLLLRVFFALGHAEEGARTYVLCAFCALTGALLMGWFDHIWYHFGNFALFFIMAAWCAVAFANRRENREYVGK